MIACWPVLAAAIFSRSLGASIRALTLGAQALTGGDYRARLQLDREDELGLYEDLLADTLYRLRRSHVLAVL